MQYIYMYILSKQQLMNCTSHLQSVCVCVCVCVCVFQIERNAFLNLKNLRK